MAFSFNFTEKWNTSTWKEVKRNIRQPNHDTKIDIQGKNQRWTRDRSKTLKRNEKLDRIIIVT